jgi:7-cyano-7-deazaguanine synthase in queuosine biosynthesis
VANDHLILCGGSRPSTKNQAWQAAKTVELRINEDPGRINCKISDITEKLTSNLRDIELDLLEIAAYIYGADQATTRGGTVRIDYGQAWYRNFRFEIPVRRQDFWSSAEVQHDLSRTLHDLSGDNFEFAYSPHSKPSEMPSYFEWGKDETTGVNEVLLFSGGLDSLGGAVQEILRLKQKAVLISHRANPKIDARQKRLVTDLGSCVGDRRLSPAHVPVWVNKAKELNKEYTQRTRSFLFASIAAIVARLFGLDRIRFFENGITSMNLPVSPQVLSTRASRTTHPKPLSGMRSLFSRVFPGGFGIENPFFWKTKAQILKEIKEAGYSRLCAGTVSCAHTWEMTTAYPHCGKCSQCLERRLVALAAGFDDKEDPSKLYRFNVFEGSLEGLDRILFESYVEVVNRIQRIDNAVNFCVAFPETSRALNFIDGEADSIAGKIFKLYKQHADEVGEALDAQGRQSFPRLRRSELPVDCLLSIAAAGLRQIPGASSGQSKPGDKKTEPTGANGQNEPLVIDETTFKITWQGREPLEIGNRKEFHLLTLLASSRNQYISQTDLAQGLGGDELDKVTHIKSRLVKFLKNNGLEDLASRIKSQRGHYGLFIS